MSAVELRPYQREAIEAIAERYRAGVRRPLLSLPTGTGKTMVFSTIAKGAVAKGRRVLILAHRDELLAQAVEKLERVAPELAGEAGLVQGPHDEYDRRVVVASVQTLSRRRRLWRVLDAHARLLLGASTYQQVIAPLALAELEARSRATEARRLARDAESIADAAEQAESLDRYTLAQEAGTLAELAAVAEAEHETSAAALDEAYAGPVAQRPPFDVVIVDEAHHGPAATYQRVLAGLGCLAESGGPLTVGVTATAERADSKSIGETFQEVVYHRDILSMMRDGYLCDLKGVSVRLARFDAGELTVRRGDYAEEEAGEALEDADAPMHVVQAWQRHAADRRTIVFTPTIRLAQQIAEEFQEAGVSAESVSGVSLDERRLILDRFARGETLVACNAQILTEGYDSPQVSCIVVARPTRSHPFFCQMIGRGTRPFPGKDDCLVLDVVGATDAHDLMTLPRLFGAEEGEAEALDDDADAVAMPESVLERDERLAAEGRIVARRVDLFKRQNLHWTCASPSLWVLSLADESVCLEARDDGRWDVVRYPKGGQPATIAIGLDQGYALGRAEDFARQSAAFIARFVDKAAAWRQRPASAKQVRTLRRWGYPVPPCPACAGVGDEDCPRCEGGGSAWRKGEASDLMTSEIARRQQRQAARR